MSLSSCTRRTNKILCILSCCRYDRLVIPIHQRTPYQHWTVLLVDLVQQRLVFFDSYKTDNPIGPKALQRVKTWLKDEAKVRTKGAGVQAKGAMRQDGDRTDSLHQHWTVLLVDLGSSGWCC